MIKPKMCWFYDLPLKIQPIPRDSWTAFYGRFLWGGQKRRCTCKDTTYNIKYPQWYSNQQPCDYYRFPVFYLSLSPQLPMINYVLGAFLHFEVRVIANILGHKPKSHEGDLQIFFFFFCRLRSYMYTEPKFFRSVHPI